MSFSKRYQEAANWSSTFSNLRFNVEIKPSCRVCNQMLLFTCTNGARACLTKCLTSRFRICCSGSLAAARWVQPSGGPVIEIGQQLPFMMWNDPSVIKDGDVYKMWLSGGDLRNLNSIVVKVYGAQSTDGISWQIDPQPMVSPGTKSAWDSQRIETPSVIKVNGVYHMYYAGSNADAAAAGTSSIGHATSPDGIVWTKDPSNPVVTAQTTITTQWGYGGVGEPAVVYNPLSGIFYLYYVSMRRKPTNTSIAEIGVLLAESYDGTHFTNVTDGSGQRTCVLTRDVPGAPNGAWFGYSSPGALITKDGLFHLFVSFLVAPVGPNSAQQVVIDHAKSTDGVNFKLAESNIESAGEGDWKSHQVRSPSVIEEAGHLKMWFAGETMAPYFAAGIGFAIE